MAKTKDYLDYLNTEVEIAPASSQEELDCAQTLAGVFASHGLEPSVEEFSAPSFGNVTRGAAMALVFIGAVLVGLGGAAMFVGFVLLAVSVALLAMGYFGNDVLANLGPHAKSQNVVAFHAAEGEGTTRNKPIVILAHYDTQRVDLLSRPGISVVKKYLALYIPQLLIAVCVCALAQLLVFLPEPLRRTLWVVGIIASLPVVAWGACLIASRFMPYTQGAVDNKSSVAAMLGVLEDLSGAAAPSGAEQEPVEEAGAQPEAAPAEPQMRRVVEEVVGTRHGERVLRDLGILPLECEITYIEPEVRLVPVPASEVPAPAEVAPKPAPASAPAAPVEAVVAPVPQQTPAPAEETRELPVAKPAPAQSPAPASMADGSALSDVTRPLNEPVVEQEALEEELMLDAPARDYEQDESYEAETASDAESTRPLARIHAPRIDAASAISQAVEGAKSVADRLSSLMAERLSKLENGQRTDEGPVVETEQEGLDTMVAEDAEAASSAVREERIVPEAIDDPEWGKSSFEPAVESSEAAGVPSDQASVAEAAPIESDAALSAEETIPVARQDIAAQLPVTQPVAQPAAESVAQPSVSQAVPDASNIARRASLFDLPDPSAEEQDSLAAEPVSEPVAHVALRPGAPAPVRIDNEVPVVQTSASQASPRVADDIQVLSADATHIDRPAKVQHRHGIFGHKESQQAESMSSWLGVDENYDAKESGEQIGSWDNFGDADAKNHWKGGAARSAETRGNAHEDESDLRDEILGMDEDQLRAHDIWFVATGGSSLGHAGAKHFLEQYRKRLRGAFIINLECVGAGDLALLSCEGFGDSRKADRRIIRLISSVAKDLHVGMSHFDRPWADTEATPLMRRSMRAVTLMGVGEAELPAFAHTEADVPENVDATQVADVSAILSEVIRRA